MDFVQLNFKLYLKKLLKSRLENCFLNFKIELCILCNTKKGLQKILVSTYAIQIDTVLKSDRFVEEQILLKRVGKASSTANYLCFLTV